MHEEGLVEVAGALGEGLQLIEAPGALGGVAGEGLQLVEVAEALGGVAGEAGRPGFTR